MSEKPGTITILGLSVAAVSAGAKLLEAGRHVEIYEIEDDLSLREQFLISNGGFGNQVLVGGEYEDWARNMLRKAGAILMGESRFLSLRSGRETVMLELRRMAGVSWFDTQGVKILFAPNGRPGSTPLLDKPSASKGLGFGLSLSAWADAPFFREKKVAVVGNTPWALEQAAWAAGYARQTKIFSELEQIPGSMQLLDAVDRLHVEFVTHASVSDVLLTAAGEVRAIAYYRANEYFEEDFDGVFLAPAIEPNWEQVAGEATAREMTDRGVLFTAGICNGIQYNAHAQLSMDGFRAAESILES